MTNTTTNSDNYLEELNNAQKVMLKMSDEDIAQGRVISQNALDEADLGWLNGFAAED